MYLRKQQTCKISGPASHFGLKWGKCHRNFEMMTVAFLEETLGRTQVLEWISELESGVTLSDVLQEWNVH
jgi:hypothetical protein